MREFFNNLFFTIAFFCFTGAMNAQSEESNYLILKLKELNTTTNFYKVVDSIQRGQDNCDYYNDTLFWKATITQKGEKFILVLTMVSNLGVLLDVNDNVYGVYSQSKEPIIVIGEDACKLFSYTGKNEKIKYLPKPEVVIEEDYPLWVYESTPDLNWKLSEKYLFPCD